MCNDLMRFHALMIFFKPKKKFPEMNTQTSTLFTTKTFQQTHFLAKYQLNMPIQLDTSWMAEFNTNG